MEKSFTIKVPASTSNLGPGFDVLGLALDIYNEYSFEISDAADFEFTADVDGLPSGKDNLVYKSFAHLVQQSDQSGAQVPGLKVQLKAGIPLCGGFGSSSTAVVAGLMAANEVLDKQYSEAELLKIATELEGHPDNVAAAILGGFVICTQADGSACLKRPWLKALKLAVLVPNTSMPTQKAREALPKQVDFRDALFNVSRMGALIAGIDSGDLDVFRSGEVFQDRLHQSYRAALVPGMTEVLRVGNESMALGAMISGAGAALLVISDSQDILEQSSKAMQEEWAKHDIQAEIKYVNANDSGAQVV